MSSAELAETQLEQLRSLVAELFPGNRFYSSKLAAAGVTFDVGGLADYSKRFPFTHKSELVADQMAEPPYGTNLTYPLTSYTRCHQTSGTRGSPLRWLDTEESWAGLVESWIEVWRAAGLQPGDRVFFAFSFGPFIGFWLAFESAAKLGGLCLPGGGLSSAARLRSILEQGATHLCCTPTYAIRLAEVASEEGISLQGSPVRGLIVAGEPGGSIPAVRTRLETMWPGARVFDHHGMTETGPVSYECPARPGVLHVIERSYFAEIVDPASGAARRSGETGELVLTTLGRTASPLLRYRTGDLVCSSEASPDAPCACGRFELALEGGILGRTDDMVVIRGVNVYPSAVDEIVRSCPAAGEYLVEVREARGLAELNLKVEPSESGESSGLVRELERRFETALALRVNIEVLARGTLPRYEMKARRWVRK
jgi:phenylacetate-CoA ligase